MFYFYKEAAVSGGSPRKKTCEDFDIRWAFPLSSLNYLSIDVMILIGHRGFFSVKGH